jgi:predicted murein hydrolase (TIGR00659 family)
MSAHMQTACMIALTVFLYLSARRIYLRRPHPLLNIVIWSSAALMVFLVACDIPYTDYLPARKIMTSPLGAATVGLAVPLYRYRKLLREAAAAIIASVAAGTLLSMILSGLICKYAGLPWEIVVSMTPKGASIPFAVEIARMYDGIPPLSAAFVAATGTCMGPICLMLLNWIRVGDPLARGLALGTVAHAQGVALSLMENQQQGAMSGLAMILAGLFTAGLAPPAFRLLQIM